MNTEITKIIETLIITYSIEVSLVLRILADVIILFFFLPLQIKQVAVKNGLGKLRKQLLAEGLILFFVNNISAFFLYDLFVNGTEQKLINASLQIINAIAFLGMAVIALTIYTQNYNAKTKKTHERIDALEKREAEIANKQ